MGISESAFEALCNDMEDLVLKELVGQSKTLSESEQSELMDFYNVRFHTDITKAGVVAA
jgi:hypothetical protein